MSQWKSMIGQLGPPIITTGTTQDFMPDMEKLNSTENIGGGEMVPSLATSTITETAATLEKKTADIPLVKKDISKLTVEQVYNNTIKTSVGIVNDFGDLISEKEVISNTEFRRRLVRMFLTEERRMYVGILLIVLSFILYFIDSSA